MNTSRKLLIAGVAALSVAGISSSALAQASATATGSASATIFKPIKLTAVTALSFGKFALSGTSGGSTTIDETADSLTGTTGLTAISGGTVSRAVFTLNGDAQATYTITLPSSAVSMTNSNGTGTVTLSNFVSDHPTLNGSDQDLHVGAKLNVSSDAGGGAWSGTFPVTVAYN